MRLKIFAFFLALSFSSAVRSESVHDSLRRAYRAAGSPREKTDILLELAAQERQMDMPNARIHTREALTHALGNGYRYGTGKAYYMLGLIAASDQMLDSVLYYQLLARSYFDRETERADVARSLNESGIALEAKAEFKKAAASYFMALQIFRDIKDEKGVTNEYTNIGLIYHYQQNFRLAEYYFRKALTLSEAIGYEEGQANAWNNLGMNYQEKKQFGTALYYFRKLLAHDLKTGNPTYIAGSYNNIGVVLSGLGNYSEALEWFQKSSRMKEESKDYRGLANTSNNIADALIALHRYGEAKKHLERAMALAASVQFRINLEETYEHYYRLYSNTGDHEKALQYFMRYAAIRDSTYRMQNQAEIARLNGEYETASRDREIILKTAEINRDRIFLGFFIFLLTAFFLAVLYLFVMLRNKQRIYHVLEKQQEEIRLQNTELKRINLEIVQAKENAEEAVKAKSQFLSVMSHEIRTPLNAIVGITNLMADANTQPEQEENLSVLKVSSGHLLELINDILDLNKLEAGKLELESIDFNLHSLLQNVREMFLPKATQKGINLRLITGNNVPAQLNGDPLRLNQVLTNLLSNALKFTERGSITIEVQLTSRARNVYNVRFSVIDTGIGIPREKREKIFESFTQADSATTRKYGGTGLGLSICRKLLQMVDSDLRVTSEAGNGSCFSFDLVFMVAEGEPGVTRSGRVNYSRLSGKKVLVAEDNNVNVYVLTQFLKRWQVQVDFAINGREALEMARTRSYDIILMDVHMPVMDGLEATRRIRATDKSIPIMALTAASDEEMKRRVKESGMDDFILKPFNPDELCEKMMTLLSGVLQ